MPIEKDTSSWLRKYKLRLYYPPTNHIFIHTSQPISQSSRDIAKIIPSHCATDGVEASISRAAMFAWGTENHTPYVWRTNENINMRETQIELSARSHTCMYVYTYVYAHAYTCTHPATQHLIEGLKKFLHSTRDKCQDKPT
jgi:hypothetical protein